MKFIVITYDTNAEFTNSTFEDELIQDAADDFSAVCVGKGMGFNQRDLDFEVPNTNAQAFATEMDELGYIVSKSWEKEL